MKDRKSIPKSALARIYFIDREIASGKYPNTKTLANAYEIGTATISRDLEFLRYQLGAPVEYDPRHRGFYYTEKTFRLPATFASPDELMALGMAKTLLSLYQNTPVYDAARQLLETITTPLEGGGQPGWFEERIIVPPVPSVNMVPEIWQTVCEGLRENRILTFEYRAYWEEGYRQRRVHPYQLLFDNGAWYLYAWSEERQGKRMFSLPRIRNISLQDEHFDLPPDWNYRRHTDGSFLGVYTDDKKRRFKIRFYNDAAMRIQERSWAEDQVITGIEGGVLLEFTSAQYGKILELVLAQGRDAEPLEPVELVKDWTDNIRDMMNRVKTPE